MPKNVYMYKGTPYTSIVALQKGTGIPLKIIQLSLEEYKASDKSKTFENILDARVLASNNRKKLLKENLEIASQLCGKEVRTWGEASKLEPVRGLLNYTGVDDLDTNKVIRLGLEMQKRGHLWLIQSYKEVKPFTFRGITYTTKGDFLRHYRIIMSTLLTLYMKFQGDLEKAIIHCEDDPSFGEHYTPFIKGVPYQSTYQASQELGFEAKTFREYVRRGYTDDEAYELTMSRAKKGFDLSEVFPTTVAGKPFQTREEFAKHLGITDYLLATCFYHKGMSLEEIYNQFTSYYMELDNRIFKTKQEVVQFLKLNRTTYNLLEKGYDSTEQLATYLSNHKVLINNQFYYAPTQLMELFNLGNTAMARALWKELQELKQDENSLYSYCKQYMSRHSKIITWLNKNSNDYLIRDIAKANGVGIDPLLAILDNSSTYAHYLVNLENYKKLRDSSRRKPREQE